MIHKIKEYVHDLTCFGSLAFYGAVTAFFLFIQEYEMFIRLIVGIISVFAIALVIRTFYFKKRPMHKGQDLTFKSFIHKIDASSFPSVHAARASIIGVMTYSLFETGLILFFVSVSIGCVMATRIILKKHDFIDVIAGTIIGILIGYILFFF